MKKKKSKKIYSILKLKNKHPSKRGKGIFKREDKPPTKRQHPNPQNLYTRFP
jgi:hypothetical protein